MKTSDIEKHMNLQSDLFWNGLFGCFSCLILALLMRFQTARPSRGATGSPRQKTPSDERQRTRGGNCDQGHKDLKKIRRCRYRSAGARERRTGRCRIHLSTRRAWTRRVAAKCSSLGGRARGVGAPAANANVVQPSPTGLAFLRQATLNGEKGI